jgi:hypothetical protein
VQLDGRMVKKEMERSLEERVREGLGIMRSSSASASGSRSQPQPQQTNASAYGFVGSPTPTPIPTGVPVAYPASHSQPQPHYHLNPNQNLATLASDPRVLAATSDMERKYLVSLTRGSTPISSPSLTGSGVAPGLNGNVSAYGSGSGSGSGGVVVVKSEKEEKDEREKRGLKPLYTFAPRTFHATPSTSTSSSSLQGNPYASLATSAPAPVAATSSGKGKGKGKAREPPMGSLSLDVRIKQEQEDVKPVIGRNGEIIGVPVVPSYGSGTMQYASVPAAATNGVRYPPTTTATGTGAGATTNPYAFPPYGVPYAYPYPPLHVPPTAISLTQQHLAPSGEAVRQMLEDRLRQGGSESEMASLREMYVGMFGVEFDARAVTNPSAPSVSRAGSGSAVSGVNGYNGYHYVPSASASASASYAQPHAHAPHSGPASSGNLSTTLRPAFPSLSKSTQSKKKAGKEVRVKLEDEGEEKLEPVDDGLWIKRIKRVKLTLGTKTRPIKVEDHDNSPTISPTTGRKLPKVKLTVSPLSSKMDGRKKEKDVLPVNDSDPSSDFKGKDQAAHGQYPFPPAATAATTRTTKNDTFISSSPRLSNSSSSQIISAYSRSTSNSGYRWPPPLPGPRLAPLLVQTPHGARSFAHTHVKSEPHEPIPGFSFSSTTSHSLAHNYTSYPSLSHPGVGGTTSSNASFNDRRLEDSEQREALDPVLRINQRPLPGLPSLIGVRDEAFIDVDALPSPSDKLQHENDDDGERRREEEEKLRPSTKISVAPQAKPVPASTSTHAPANPKVNGAPNGLPMDVGEEDDDTDLDMMGLVYPEDEEGIGDGEAAETQSVYSFFSLFGSEFSFFSLLFF